MPSLVHSTPKDSKKPKNKNPELEPLAMDAATPAVEEKKSKDKKKKKHSKTDTEDGVVTGINDDDENRKEKKKRKASDEEKSDTSSDAGEPIVDRKPAKKLKAVEKDEGLPSDEDGEVTVSWDEDDEKEADPNALSNFRISEVLREKLNSNGIVALFFDTSHDLPYHPRRLRFGWKTLTFVLPILESFTDGRHKFSRKTGYGRPPSLLMLPTNKY